MRTTLLVCACLASFLLGSRLPAQDSVTTSDPAEGATCDNSSAGPDCGDPSDGAVCDNSSEGPNCGDPADGANCYDPADDGMVFYDPVTGAACSNPQPGMSYYAKRASALSGDPCDSSGGAGGKRKHLGHIHALKKKLYQHCLNKHHCNGNGPAQRRAALTPWHGDYYQPEWGAPVALVVPPTAEFQTNYSWGVPSSRVTPIDHQFGRTYLGTGAGGFGTRGFLAPPFQPSDTNQFGVYYVRGPW